jgi:hypothetical protein
MCISSSLCLLLLLPGGSLMCWQIGEATSKQHLILFVPAAAAAARWSTGVLAYELVAGAPPFMHEDRMVMYRRIVDGVFSCPTHFSAVSALAALDIN